MFKEQIEKAAKKYAERISNAIDHNIYIDEEIYEAFIAGANFRIKKTEKTDINERIERFKIELSKYLPDYGSDMLNEFFIYWTEKNISGVKMRFEMEKTWDISKRLVRWEKNTKKFSNGTGNNQEARGSVSNEFREAILRGIGKM